MNIMGFLGGFVNQGIHFVEEHIVEICIGTGVLALIIGYLVFIKGRGL